MMERHPGMLDGWMRRVHATDSGPLQCWLNFASCGKDAALWVEDAHLGLFPLCPIVLGTLSN
ncbi:hypothetical protein CERSUDRAFT_101731 [Gelatoporia subvermispora B]|uniref:Uncharacterized protein n=1 Tax=Ceriporiopsis subvermispora (strain B) TaxID=914234 RepID=M2P4W3_CERS8|nr:hypothetical protein CERSUDRAFT_101731 [Gelatoporia subvermispora B]